MTATLQMQVEGSMLDESRKSVIGDILNRVTIPLDVSLPACKPFLVRGEERDFSPDCLGIPDG